MKNKKDESIKLDKCNEVAMMKMKMNSAPQSVKRGSSLYYCISLQPNPS